MKRTCLILLTGMLLSINSAAQNNVGKIVDLKGTGRLRHENGKVETLIEKKDFVRNLQPKQKLRVDGNGQMQIVLCDDEKKHNVPSDKWYTVPSTIICAAAADSPIQRVLREVFVIGARHRGEKSFIRFPIESEELMDIVRPETVVLRWGSSPPVRVDLSISVVAVENVRWERKGVLAEDGSFTDDELKTFLTTVREKYPAARLQLKTRTSNTENTATFKLLSKEQEQALRQELAKLKEDNRLLSHLFRAHIYLRYLLFPEAASEYEAALKLSPDSIDLLKEVAFISDQAGNLKRRDDLESYIETLSKRNQ